MFYADFAARVMREIDEELSRKRQNVLAGQAPDHAAYKAALAYIDGLQDARKIVTDLLGKTGNF